MGEAEVQGVQLGQRGQRVSEGVKAGQLPEGGGGAEGRVGQVQGGRGGMCR